MKNFMFLAFGILEYLTSDSLRLKMAAGGGWVARITGVN